MTYLLISVRKELEIRSNYKSKYVACYELMDRIKDKEYRYMELFKVDRNKVETLLFHVSKCGDNYCIHTCNDGHY